MQPTVIRGILLLYLIAIQTILLSASTILTRKISDIYTSDANEIVATENQKATIHCQETGEYNELYSEDCNKYYHCNDKTLSLRKCWFWQNFDAITLSCKFYQWVDCNARPTTTTIPLQISIRTRELTNKETTPDHTPAISTSTAIKSYSKSNDDIVMKSHINDIFECISTGEYDEVYPGDCHKYYHCSGKTPSIQRCFFWQNFDPVKLYCRWKLFVDCNATTITTPVSPSSTISTSQVTVSMSTSMSTFTAKTPNLSTSTLVTTEGTSSPLPSHSSEITISSTSYSGSTTPESSSTTTPSSTSTSVATEGSSPLSSQSSESSTPLTSTPPASSTTTAVATEGSSTLPSESGESSTSSDLHPLQVLLHQLSFQLQHV